MIANFFIKRPIAAIVSAALLILIGAISIYVLPVTLYPNISPPNITIAGTYVGANAQTVEETVLTPIETALSGTPKMMYFKSSATAYGAFSVNVTFEIGTNMDGALLEIQTRLREAEAILPQEVKRIGITTKRVSPTILKYMIFYSPNKTYDLSFMANYMRIYIEPEIAKLPGVGQTRIDAFPFSMRVWLDPYKMAQLKINTQDVSRAIAEQNIQIAAGVVGKPPMNQDQVFEYPIPINSRLKTVEEFENIIIFVNSQNNAIVLLKDIAKVELGDESYEGERSSMGHIGPGFAIFPAVGANDLEVARLVEEKLLELYKKFPVDFVYSNPFDTTPFVRESLQEVVNILFEALLLVILVVFIFLQSWRATLIALLAIPVSIVGTFPFFILLDFSINSITLFGMILAIGIVVDDAIIVVEAVQHHIDKDKISAREATYKAMKEISSPVIATAFILAAVFVPVAFIPGITGQLFKQFAITIAVSVMISAFVALSLTPALCALMMSKNPVHQGSKGLYALFFRFNIWIEKQTGRYGRIIGKSLHHLKITFGILILFYAATGLLGKLLRTSFLPQEDRGTAFVSVILPPNTASGKTIEVLQKIAPIIQANPNVLNYIYVSHRNALLGGVNLSNSATIFVRLKDFKFRTKQGLVGRAFTEQLQQELNVISDAKIQVLSFPPIDGLGGVDGFTFVLKQQQGTPQELDQTTQAFLANLRKQPEIGAAFSGFSANTPKINLEIDRKKVAQLGVTLLDINNALQTFLGGVYVNDFNMYNQNYKVYLQADNSVRDKIDRISTFHVRNKNGEMIPLSNLLSYEFAADAQVINHFNMKRSVDINGSAAKGYSSGDVLSALNRVAQDLPNNYSFEFANMSLQEIRAGNASILILCLSLVFVFLFLAAFYESWTIPFAVLGAVPLGIFGAFFALYFAGFENSIYAQIGLVTLIGLGVKTSILIVEFCKEKQEAGVPLMQAAIEAATLRLRPILMTGLAFIFGVIALITTRGAGAGSKNNLGWTVFGGMIAIVFISIFFVPALYVAIVRLKERVLKLGKKH